MTPIRAAATTAREIHERQTGDGVRAGEIDAAAGPAATATVVAVFDRAVVATHVDRARDRDLIGEDKHDAAAIAAATERGAGRVSARAAAGSKEELPQRAIPHRVAAGASRHVAAGA